MGVAIVTWHELEDDVLVLTAIFKLFEKHTSTKYSLLSCKV